MTLKTILSKIKGGKEKSITEQNIKSTTFEVQRSARLKDSSTILRYLFALDVGDTFKLNNCRSAATNISETYLVQKYKNFYMYNIIIYKVADLNNIDLPELDCWVLVDKETSKIHTISFDKGIFLATIIL